MRVSVWSWECAFLEVSAADGHLPTLDAPPGR